MTAISTIVEIAVQITATGEEVRSKKSILRIKN